MRHNDLFLTPGNLSAYSPEEALAKNTLGLDLLLFSTLDPQVDWFAWEPGCPVAGQRFQTVKVRQLDTSLRGLTRTFDFAFPSFGGESLYPIQYSVHHQPPVLVPVNQQALLSNATAFATFLCVHNIEALKQA